MASRHNKENGKRQCIKKFLYYFKRGFSDEKYLSWERNYKWNAHLEWEKLLNRKEYKKLLDAQDYPEIAKRVIKLESRTNLLFSFEKMALRDAVKDEGAELFAKGLYSFVYGAASPRKRFEEFSLILSALPRKQTRVLTWPLQTIFGFIADPEHHIFLKPRVTQTAALHYGYDFKYLSKPNWDTYQSLQGFAQELKSDLEKLHPKDLIDIQSFIWVLGSSEYPW